MYNSVIHQYTHRLRNKLVFKGLVHKKNPVQNSVCEAHYHIQYINRVQTSFTNVREARKNHLKYLQGVKEKPIAVS